MTNTGDQSPSGAVVSEIFAYSGIECRLTISQSPAGYAAMAYCPYCGKGIDSGKSDANQESAILRSKAEFQNHLGRCPLRNSHRPPLGVNPISPSSDNAGR
jgi:hypothetical protein